MFFEGCHVQLVSSSNSNGTIGVLKTYPYNGSYNATCFEMHHCDNISFIVRLHIFKLWTAWLSISNVDEYFISTDINVRNLPLLASLIRIWYISKENYAVGFLDRLIKKSVFLSFNFYGYIHFDVLLTSTFSALFYKLYPRYTSCECYCRSNLIK